MKRIALSAIAIAVCLAGCASTVTPEQMNASMAQAATLIANGCKVVQPALADAAPLTGNAAVSAGAAINGVLCAADEAVAPAAAAPAAAK